MPDPQPTLTTRLQQYWFEPKSGLLKPHEWLILQALEWLYRLLLGVRNLLASPPSRAYPGVRSLSVGNLIIGGAGKTPAVMAIASALGDSGRVIGILSRGYKSRAEHGPIQVLTPQRLAHVGVQDVGDEPWLLCWRTGLPVAVGKDRFASLKALKAAFPDLDTVILDDGLSQRTLRADRTFLVMDSRGFGNHHCLPLGPLREPAKKLNRFDAWIDNGFAQGMPQEDLPPQRIGLSQTNVCWVRVDRWQTPQEWLGIEDGLDQFRKGRILAVAAIAVPARFFQALESLRLEFDAMPLADHDPELVVKVIQRCSSQRYDFILMTEKDAVKFFHHPCAVRENIWALRRQATLDTEAIERLIHGL